MTMISLPRETKEYIPVTVQIDGVTTNTGVELVVMPANARPSGWAAAVLDPQGRTMVLVDSLSAGIYAVWARVTAGDEVSVIEAGEIAIT